MPLNTILNVKKAIIHFLCAYLIVTILAYSVSILVGMILKLPYNPDPGASPFDQPEFVKTVRYHLLINLLVWTIFGYAYFRKTKDNTHSNLKAALYLGGFWLLLAVIVDGVGFVLIKSPVSLTPHQFYIEYQPWITITYVIVLISPAISYGLLKYKTQ